MQCVFSSLLTSALSVYDPCLRYQLSGTLQFLLVTNLLQQLQFLEIQTPANAITTLEESIQTNLQSILCHLWYLCSFDLSQMNQQDITCYFQHLGLIYKTFLRTDLILECSYDQIHVKVQIYKKTSLTWKRTYLYVWFQFA